MSANLLADLDSFYQNDSREQNVSNQLPQSSFTTDSKGSEFPASNSQNLLSDRQPWSNLEPPENDDDDFGDFETGQQELENKPESLNLQSAGQPADFVDWNRQPQAFASKSRDFQLQADVSWENYSRSPDPFSESAIRAFHNTNLTSRNASVPKKRRDESVLFDAEDEDGESGDFGEFEDAESSKPPTGQQSLDVKLLPIERRANEIKPPAPRKMEASLLDFDNEEPTGFTSPILSANTSNEHSGLRWVEPKTTANLYTSSKAGGSTQTTPQEASFSTFEQPDDTWDDFETAAPPPISAPETTAEKIQAPAVLNLPNILPPDSSIDSPTSQQPPSNIPPPAVLLSLIIPVVAAAKTHLFEPLAALSSSSQQASRSAVLSDPATEKFLRSYIAVITVAGRIIAGRKLRWKRDNLLSQSMRIGPSMGGRSGGMKLTGVDKSESAREDREVADVVRAYRAQIGRLRTAVTGAGLVNESGPTKLIVPELAEAMPVRTATGAEGAIVATKSCALCGIKRNERVGKVDSEVSDAFGEWWIEFWGHRACRNFWEGKKEDLAQR